MLIVPAWTPKAYRLYVTACCLGWRWLCRYQSAIGVLAKSPKIAYRPCLSVQSVLYRLNLFFDKFLSLGVTMRDIVIDQKGYQLTYDRQLLILHHPSFNRPVTLPFSQIQSITLVSSVVLNSTLLTKLADCRIAVMTSVRSSVKRRWCWFGICSRKKICLALPRPTMTSLSKLSNRSKIRLQTDLTIRSIRHWRYLWAFSRQNFLFFVNLLEMLRCIWILSNHLLLWLFLCFWGRCHLRLCFLFGG